MKHSSLPQCCAGAFLPVTSSAPDFKLLCRASRTEQFQVQQAVRQQQATLEQEWQQIEKAADSVQIQRVSVDKRKFEAAQQEAATKLIAQGVLQEQQELEIERGEVSRAQQLQMKWKLQLNQQRVQLGAVQSQLEADRKQLAEQQAKMEQQQQQLQADREAADVEAAAIVRERAELDLRHSEVQKIVDEGAALKLARKLMAEQRVELDSWRVQVEKVQSFVSVDCIRSWASALATERAQLMGSRQAMASSPLLNALQDSQQIERDREKSIRFQKFLARGSNSTLVPDRPPG